MDFELFSSFVIRSGRGRRQMGKITADKRVFAFLIVIAASIAALTCGCAKQQAYKGELEIEESRFFFVDSGFAAYHEGTLYFTEPAFSGRKPFVYFADTETGECMPLCGKPECSHDNNNCNAYLDGLYGGNPLFTVYNNKIYWRRFEKAKTELIPILCSMNLDGTMRKDVMSLDYALEEFMNVGFLGIYDGKLFRCGSGETVEDSEPVYSVTVYSQELTGEADPNVILHMKGYNGILARMNGNVLYIACFARGEDEKLLLLSYNMDDETLTELYSGSDFPCSAQSIFVVGDSIVFSGGITAYSYSLNNGEISPISSDPDKHLVFVSEDRIFTFTSASTYSCTDFSSGSVCTGELPDECLDGRLKYPLGSIDGTFYFFFAGFTEEQKSILASYDPSDDCFSVLAMLP